MRSAARRLSWWTVQVFLVAAACGGTTAPPDEGYLTGAEGAEIHYRVLGTGTDTVVIVHGERDSAALALQHDWAAAVPRGRLLAVSGAGKAAVSDRPEVVFPAVTAFLNGEWPEGSAAVERSGSEAEADAGDR